MSAGLWEAFTVGLALGVDDFAEALGLAVAGFPGLSSIALTPKAMLQHPVSITALTLVFLAFLFLTVVRPWYQTWGTVPADQTRTLPGDELVPNPTGGSTRAVLIHAPAKDVWPWLVQVGYHRAGWYNLDWLNRMLGAADFVDGHRSADRIIPELQDLKVGDRILMVPQQGWTVAALEPERHLVLKGDGSIMSMTLEPVDATTTRLFFRNRAVIKQSDQWIYTLLDPGIFIQESRFMLGVKKRAERLFQTGSGEGRR